MHSIESDMTRRAVGAGCPGRHCELDLAPNFNTLNLTGKATPRARSCSLRPSADDRATGAGRLVPSGRRSSGTPPCPLTVNVIAAGALA